MTRKLISFVSVPSKTSLVDYAQVMSEAIQAADGDWLCFAGEGTVSVLRAGRLLSEAISQSPETDIFYTDEEDAATGERFLKPAFSPERLRSQDYISATAFFRASLIASIGSIRHDRPGAELYDLTLRATASSSNVLHITETIFDRPRVRPPLPSDEDAATVRESIRRTLEDHLGSTGGGAVESVGNSGTHVTHRAVIGSPLVSIIIPTRGDSAMIRGSNRCLVIEAVRSVVELSSYSNIEFVLVIDDVVPAKVTEQLVAIAGDRIRFVPWSSPFSFSGKMNLGVLHSRGEYLLFLNDDVEVISPGWIEAMLSLAQLPGAGLAGAMLYFEDDTIQHAGHAYYRSDVTHIGLNSERGAAGQLTHSLWIARWME